MGSSSLCVAVAILAILVPSPTFRGALGQGVDFGAIFDILEMAADDFTINLPPPDNLGNNPAGGNDMALPTPDELTNDMDAVGNLPLDMVPTEAPDVAPTPGPNAFDPMGDSPIVPDYEQEFAFEDPSVLLLQFRPDRIGKGTVGNNYNFADGIDDEVIPIKPRSTMTKMLPPAA